MHSAKPTYKRSLRSLPAGHPSRQVLNAYCTKRWGWKGEGVTEKSREGLLGNLEEFVCGDTSKVFLLIFNFLEGSYLCDLITEQKTSM